MHRQPAQQGHLFVPSPALDARQSEPCKYGVNCSRFLSVLETPFYTPTICLFPSWRAAKAGLALVLAATSLASGSGLEIEASWTSGPIVFGES
jgi:hypothetical protein